MTYSTMLATPDETGKNIGDDLAEGKITLPLLHAMKVGDATDRRLVADLSLIHI